MKHFIYAAKAMAITAKNLFRPVITEHFGREIKDRGARYRNSFALLHDPSKHDHQGNAIDEPEELCIACSKCALICPSDIITVTKGPKAPSNVTGKNRGFLEDFTLDMNACIFCELCVQVCPVDAIVMCQEATQPGFFREDLVMTMDKLYANETAKPVSWATGTKLVDMQDPNRLSPEQQAAKEAKLAEAAAKKAEMAAQKAAEAAKDAETASSDKGDAAKGPESSAPAPGVPAKEPAAPAEEDAEKAAIRAKRKLQREIRNAKRFAKKEALAAGKSDEEAEAIGEAAAQAVRDEAAANGATT